MIKKIIKAVIDTIKNERTKTMTQQQTTDKKKTSLVTYAYGQVYRAYLESGKKRKFKITNIHVREWRKILGWMKKHEYIIDFKLGETIETACELEVEGFNEKNLIYKNYLKAIERNFEAEKVA